MLVGVVTLPRCNDNFIQSSAGNILQNSYKHALGVLFQRMC